jgi:F-type H+-transporting ATPase subunit b
MYRLCSAAVFGALLVLALSAASCWAPQARSQEEPAPPAEKPVESHGGAKVDVPEGIFKGSTDLLIWTLVVFGLLLFILGRYAWAPMLEGLKKREDNIRVAAEDAQRARDEAQQLRTQLQQEMARSHEQVQQMIDEGRRNAQRNADEVMARAKAEVQTERQRLHREIEAARDQALQQIRDEVVRVAAAVTTKAIRRELTPDGHRRLADVAKSAWSTPGGVPT